jgi:hypothetical protein
LNHPQQRIIQKEGVHFSLLLHLSRFPCLACDMMMIFMYEIMLHTHSCSSLVVFHGYRQVRILYLIFRRKVGCSNEFDDKFSFSRLK